MADRGMIFSAPMVRALLAGRKTQMRQPLTRLHHFGRIIEFGRSDTRGYDWHFRDAAMRWHDLRDSRLRECLPYVVGDRIWVRETWQTGMGDGPQIVYRATPDPADINAWDGPDEGAGPSFNYARCPGATWFTWLPDLLNGAEGCWRSPIHMPRWASRLTLTVTDVRVERVQDISEDDARAEGLSPAPGGWWSGAEGQAGGTPRAAYGLLWNSLHGPDAWAANPWVAAISFAVEQRNIDAPAAIAPKPEPLHA